MGQTTVKTPIIQVSPRDIDAYATLYRAFGWQVPERMNMAWWCCTRWAQDSSTSKNIAIEVHHSPTGSPKTSKTQACSYAQFDAHAQRLAAHLSALGVARGDRVAIVLPQRIETAVAYMAVLRLGAVAVPLSQLFGPDALSYRLQDSGAVAAIVDASTRAGLNAVAKDCPALQHVLDADGPDWMGTAQAHAELADTAADDPAVLIYTSGTTGSPKGALIPHRALIGNLSGFVASQNWFGFDPATGRAEFRPTFWSPADWAWTGGLMDALLPTLYFGARIVAYSGRFSADVAFDIFEQHRVTHTFLFPTALKAMMKARPKIDARTRRALRLHGLMSAGEALGDAVFTWCVDELGVTPNEMFGQTEINYIVGNCARLWAPKPGSMGKAYPGHRVALIDDDGKPVARGEVGEVAVHRRDIHGEPDPVFFLGYWNKPQATLEKFTGDPLDSWCRTGDLALEDAEGYLWYQGRADDMFKSAGYRIGPGEIENCLLKHPAVANAAVVPKPDTERGALVKAYVVIAPDFIAANAQNTPTCSPKSFKDIPEPTLEALIRDLQAHVKSQLAPYEYPKEIEFIDALPMTTTGKVQRRVLRLQEEARFAAR